MEGDFSLPMQTLPSNQPPHKPHPKPDSSFPHASLLLNSPFVGWTAQEDANLIWLLTSCPLTENSKTLISVFPGRSIQEIFQRYHEILGNKELSARVIKETGGDILSYKPVSYTRSEFCNLARLSEINGKCLPTQFLNSFPSLFHPARYAGSLMSTYNRLRNHGQNSYSYQNQLFQDFRQSIQSDIKNLPLESVQGFDDPEATLRKINHSETTFLSESLTSQNSIKNIQILIQKQMSKRTFGSLVGIGPPRYINKARTLIGRQSPKVQPDIDLSDLNLQSISRRHCFILFCSDFFFYLDVLAKNVIVNGIVFQKNTKVRLQNGDILDIGGAPFIFFENFDLLHSLRNINSESN